MERKLNLTLDEETSFGMSLVDNSLMLVWLRRTDIMNIFWTRVITLQFRKPHFYHGSGLFTEEEMLKWLENDRLNRPTAGDEAV